MAEFIPALEFVLGLEGGYSNHKEDSGGATNYGITEKLARSYGYKGHMKDLTLEIAANIYKKEFWDKLKLEQLDNQYLAIRIFDISVNCGRSKGTKIVQNAYNNMWSTKSKLSVDGMIGRRTISRLNAVSKGNNLSRLCVNISGWLVHHYVSLCMKKSKNTKFIYGWLIKRGHIVENVKF